MHSGVRGKGWNLPAFLTVFSSLQLNHLDEENSGRLLPGCCVLSLSPFLDVSCSFNSCSVGAYYMPGSESQHLRDSNPVRVIEKEMDIYNRAVSVGGVSYNRAREDI